MKYRHIDTLRRNSSMNDLMSLNFIFNKFYETYVAPRFHEVTFE